MQIAVLGGGNGSHAAAVDLSANGHEVRFWRRNADQAAALRDRGNRMILKDFKGERDVTISQVTDDIAIALDGAALIVCPAPAFAQRDIARQMAPHLRDGQVVFLPPGSFGSVIMAQEIAAAGNKADVTFAEAGTLPYLTRMHGPDTIAITTRATRLPSGIFPTRNSAQALSILKQAYPAVEDAGDALSGALMNAGPIIHPPLIIMNAGPIEHFDHWDIHNEGTQPAIRRVTDQLDSERMGLRDHLGYGPPHFPLADHYDPEAPEWMYGNAAHEHLVDSGDWRENLVLTEHRYMREDIAVGLAFLVSVANWAGVPTPVATGLLAIGSAICGEDFLKTGRILQQTGLSDLSVDRVQALLRNGL